MHHSKYRNPTRDKARDELRNEVRDKPRNEARETIQKTQSEDATHKTCDVKYDTYTG